MSPSYPEDDLERIDEIESLAWWVRWGITIIGGTLVAAFTWLQFRSEEVYLLINNTKPEILLKLTLILYYFCWIFGSNFDLRIQQSTFIKDPNRGQLPGPAVVLLTAFGLATVVLVWASDNEQRFAAALTFFWITGTIGYSYILKVIKPIIGESGRLLATRRNFLRFERLLIVARYMCGRWQWHRIALSFCLLLLVDVVSWSAGVRRTLSSFLHILTSDVAASAWEQLLPSLSFLVFVLITEAWIWFNRLRTHLSLKVLDDLKRRYSLQPREETQPL